MPVSVQTIESGGARKNQKGDTQKAMGDAKNAAKDVVNKRAAAFSSFGRPVSE